MLEFSKMRPDARGRVKEVKFARMLLAYSGLSDNKQKAIIKVGAIAKFFLVCIILLV